MQITSTSNLPLSSGINSKPTAPIKSSQRPAEIISSSEQEQSSKGQTPSIVIDEQALAQFKENQDLQASNDNSSFDRSYTSQDQPSAKNETAVASYQAVGNLAQRESVQQFFGVDLFA